MVAQRLEVEILEHCGCDEPLEGRRVAAHGDRPIAHDAIAERDSRLGERHDVHSRRSEAPAHAVHGVRESTLAWACVGYEQRDVDVAQGSGSATGQRPEEIGRYDVGFSRQRFDERRSRGVD